MTELGEQAQDQNQSGGGLLSAGEITKVSGNAADGTVSIEASVKALFPVDPGVDDDQTGRRDGKPHFEVQKATPSSSVCRPTSPSRSSTGHHHHVRTFFDG